MQTDYEKFAISASGVLTFMSPPDFDSPGDKVGADNVYNVTLVAGGGERGDGKSAVEVTVTDIDETGTVTFVDNQQPQVGESMTAELSRRGRRCRPTELAVAEVYGHGRC